MKKLTKAQKRAILENDAITKAGEFNARYNAAQLLDCAAAGGKVYLLNTRGIGKCTKYVRNKGAYCAKQIAEAMGYKVIEANDAPRGGAHGNYWCLAKRAKFTAAEIEEQLIN